MSHWVPLRLATRPTPSGVEIRDQLRVDPLNGVVDVELNARTQERQNVRSKGRVLPFLGKSVPELPGRDLAMLHRDIVNE